MVPLAALLGPIAADSHGQSDVPAAVITAVGALVVAIASAIYSAVTAHRQVLLKNRLDEESKAKDARRDYEYDARKRLYRECEPLLFQARELANEARGRITGLAMAARNGDICEDGLGWLAKPGYYSLSTCYSLVAPAAAYLLLQRRLTDFDLGLEPRIRIQYEMLKLVYASFSDDFSLANLIGVEYRPDDADPGMPNREKLLAERPAVYRRQGLYRGTIALIGDAFLADKTEAWRCKTFSEFYVEAHQQHSPIGRILPELLDMVRGFHPAMCPVLWLVLIEQLMLYDILLQCNRIEHEDAVSALDSPNVEDYVTALRWHGGHDQEKVGRPDQYLANITCIRDRVADRIQALHADFTSPRKS